MDDTDAAIEELRIQLARIVIATTNIREVLERLEGRNATTSDDAAAADPLPPNGPTDRDGNLIVIGNRVTFLTRGRHRSTRGIVTRFSRNNGIVFSLDSNRVEVARAPRNLRIVQDAL